jgi:hypothetical protein
MSEALIGESRVITPELPEDIRDHLGKRIPHLPGWCTVDKAIRLTEIVWGLRQQWPQTVELGVFGGRGLFALCTGHALREKSQRGSCVGIDPYTVEADLQGSNDPANDEWWSKIDHTKICSIALDALQQEFHQVDWALLRAYSTDLSIIEDRQRTQAKIHLLHQDSNHSEEISTQEVHLWVPVMAAGGYWIADDTDWPSTQKCQQVLREQYGARLVEDHTRWRVYKLP